MKGLALVLGLSAAHVTRPVEVAKALRAKGYQIFFAGAGKYLEIARMEGFEVYPLPGLSPERVVEAAQNGRMRQIYNLEELHQWVQAELELIKKLEPQFILSDQRITASTSAELAGLPLITINNAHMTRFREIPFFTPRMGVLKNWPLICGLMERIENWFERLFWEIIITSPLNKLRRRLGLQKRYSYAMDEGSLNIIADIPEFNPLLSPPKNFHYVGPLTWRSPLPTPPFLQQLDSTKKTIYFTVGSEGLASLLGSMKDLAENNTQIIIATGGEVTTSTQPHPNIFMEKFINADQVLPHCDLVICHGGNGTIYQALSHGVPVIAVATHDEQYYGARRVHELGLGLAFWKKQIEADNFKLLKAAIEKILNEPSYKNKAEHLKMLISKYSGPTTSAKLIEDYFKNQLNS